MKPGFLSVLVLSAFLAACGGDDDGGGDGSGVDGSKAITTLEAGEVTSFCTWVIDIQGGPDSETECGDGLTVTVPTQAECEAEYGSVPDACSGVTVSELEGCVEAFADDPCQLGGSACSEYYECSFGG
jgi:hypothetical protein